MHSVIWIFTLFYQVLGTNGPIWQGELAQSKTHRACEQMRVDLEQQGYIVPPACLELRVESSISSR